LTKEHYLKAKNNIALSYKSNNIPSYLFGFTDTVIEPYLFNKEGVMPGFDVSCYMNLHEIGLGGWSDFLKNQQYSVPKNIMDIYHNSPPIYSFEHSDTAFLTDELIRFLSVDGNNIGLTHLSYFRPHPPFVVPEPFNSMYKGVQVAQPKNSLKEFLNMHSLHKTYFESGHRGKYSDIETPKLEEKILSDMSKHKAIYYGLISELDFHLGRLINFLIEAGLYDNTMIIFTSDHGEMLGDKWLADKGGYFDQAHYVPLIVKMPKEIGVKGKHRQVNDFTSSIDLMPTLLEIQGISIPDDCQGKSLLPLLSPSYESSHSQLNNKKEYIFFENYHFIDSNIINKVLVVKDQNYKYVYCSAAQDLLFDLKSDPDELNNIISRPEYKVLVEFYREVLKKEQLL